MLNNLLKIGKNSGKRVGRGYGSGKGGHTIGRGQKGHKSRSGYANPRPGFEGGSMPLSRRIPKLKGFSRVYLKSKHAVISLDLAKVARSFESGDEITPVSLITKKIISKNAMAVKIIGNPKLDKKLVFSQIKFSATAQAAVTAAGGSIKE